MTIVADTSGRHDCLCGGSNRRPTTARYGDGVGVGPDARAPATCWRSAAPSTASSRRDLAARRSTCSSGVRVADDGGARARRRAGARRARRAAGRAGRARGRSPTPPTRSTTAPSYAARPVRVTAWRGARDRRRRPVPRRPRPSATRAFENTEDAASLEAADERPRRARRGRRGPGAVGRRRRARARRCASSTSAATRPSTACSTTRRRHRRALLGGRHDRRPAQHLPRRRARCCARTRARPMMTVTATTCAYHDTIGGACSRESNTLRYGHHTVPPARVRRQLPRRRLALRAEQARPGVEHQLVHERAGRRRRHARHRRRHLGARACTVDLRAEMDVLVVISNCPQINNPCNGFDPTPIRLAGRRRRPS